MYVKCEHAKMVYLKCAISDGRTKHFHGFLIRLSMAALYCFHQSTSMGFKIDSFRVIHRKYLQIRILHSDQYDV